MLKTVLALHLLAGDPVLVILFDLVESGKCDLAIEHIKMHADGVCLSIPSLSLRFKNFLLFDVVDSGKPRLELNKHILPVVLNQQIRLGRAPKCFHGLEVIISDISNTVGCHAEELSDCGLHVVARGVATQPTEEHFLRPSTLIVEQRDDLCPMDTLIDAFDVSVYKLINILQSMLVVCGRVENPDNIDKPLVQCIDVFVIDVGTDILCTQKLLGVLLIAEAEGVSICTEIFTVTRSLRHESSPSTQPTPVDAQDTDGTG